MRALNQRRVRLGSVRGKTAIHRNKGGKENEGGTNGKGIGGKVKVHKLDGRGNGKGVNGGCPPSVSAIKRKGAFPID